MHQSITPGLDIRRILEDFVREIYELPESQAVEDGWSVVDLGDSLQLLELVAMIERRFKLSVDIGDAMRFDELVSLVAAQARR